jgi:hypothetical protein
VKSRIAPALLLPLVLLAGAGAEAAEGAAPAAANAAKALDPAVEALLAFATDGKALLKLRPAQVIARLRDIVPIAKRENDQGLRQFAGKTASGPIASADLDFADGLHESSFRLRTDNAPELFRALAARLRKKLGKPSYANPAKNPTSMSWDIERDWTVSVFYAKSADKEVTFGVDSWVEPEQ